MRQDAELLGEFLLHLCRVDKDVIDQVILRSQRYHVQQRIICDPACTVYIVGCDDDPLAARLEVEHQESSIQVLKPVIPEDMQDPRIGAGCIPDEPRIVHKDLQHFAESAVPFSRASLEIQESYIRSLMQFRAVFAIAAD